MVIARHKRKHFPIPFQIGSIGIYLRVPNDTYPGSETTIRVSGADDFVVDALDIGPDNNFVFQSASIFQPKRITGGGPNGKDYWDLDPVRPDYLFYDHDLEMIPCEAYYIGKNDGAGLNQLSADVSNKQIRYAASNSFQITGAITLGNPQVTATNSGWHCARWKIRSNNDAQVGINATFGSATAHTETTWVNDRFGIRSASEPRDGGFSEMIVFNKALSAEEDALMAHYINAEYGLTI